MIEDDRDELIRDILTGLPSNSHAHDPYHVHTNPPDLSSAHWVSADSGGHRPLACLHFHLSWRPTFWNERNLAQKVFRDEINWRLTCFRCFPFFLWIYFLFVLDCLHQICQSMRYSNETSKWKENLLLLVLPQANRLNNRKTCWIQHELCRWTALLFETLILIRFDSAHRRRISRLK